MNKTNNIKEIAKIFTQEMVHLMSDKISNSSKFEENELGGKQ